MIGGVTRRGLPHLPGLPHLHVKIGKGIGAEMRPAIVSEIATENALVSYWSIIFPVPSNSPRSLCERLTRPSLPHVSKAAMLRLYVRLASCCYCTKQFRIPRGRRQRKRKKNYSLTRQTLHVHHAFFVLISLPDIVAGLWTT